MALPCVSMMTFEVWLNRVSYSLTCLQHHTLRMEPLENSTPQWSLCEDDHAKGNRHPSIIIKTVLTALAPCKDLRDTRPCFENDLTYDQVQ